MKKSPNKYKYSAIDPGGFFEKKQPVKPIMNEGDKSAFKMQGFPQHAGVSPMRQNEENEGTKARKRYDRIKKKHEEKRDNPTIVEPSKHDVALSERIQEKTTRENIEKKAEKREQVVTDLVEGVGMDLAKAAAVTAVGKIFSKKEKKEPVRIIGKDWKIT